MGLFQSKSVQPVQPIIFAPKVLLNFPKTETKTEPKTESKKETQAERDDRLKHAAIIFDSKKVKHHIEEQLR
jgi:hypothetical protein